MTNDLTGWLDTTRESVLQMQQQPIVVLLIPVLIVFGAMLKSLERFPNRAIPTVVILTGGIINAIFGTVHNPGAIDPETNLYFVKFIHGFLLGTGACLIHKLVLKRFEKFLPFLAGKSGDTEEFKNPNPPAKTPFDKEMP